MTDEAPTGVTAHFSVADAAARIPDTAKLRSIPLFRGAVSHANTRRLRIEALRHEHAAQLFPSIADPRIYAYIPHDPPGSVDALTRRYTLLERGAPTGSGEIWLNWAIRLRISPTYIGTLQATVYRRRTASIAYVLAPPYRGRGYATEGCQWLLDYLAFQLRIVAFRATVDTRNEPSWRLLERLRFQRTGQQIVEFRGEPVTDYSYCLRPPRGQTRRTTRTAIGSSSAGPPGAVNFRR